MARRIIDLKDRQCAHCGRSYTPTGTRARYCSVDCRAEAPPLPREATGKSYRDLTGQRFGRLIVDQVSSRRGSFSVRPGSRGTAKYAIYWLCVCDCGGIKRVLAQDLTRGMTKSCGCLHSETSRALGSIRGAAKGNWKHGLNSNGYVTTYVEGKHKLGHRIAMEAILGRPLLAGETVHHINGIRSDNRTENLELWTSRHPKGQRVEDKVAWAIEILRLYKPGMIVDG